MEILENLKTDSDKNLPLPTSEEIQPLTKYFGTFLSVILASFHPKWNRTRSLLLQTECTSYLKSCQKIKKWGNVSTITKSSEHIV